MLVEDEQHVLISIDIEESGKVRRESDCQVIQRQETRISLQARQVRGFALQFARTRLLRADMRIIIFSRRRPLMPKLNGAQSANFTLPRALLFLVFTGLGVGLFTAGIKNALTVKVCGHFG
jgi:hypothetical protein